MCGIDGMRKPSNEKLVLPANSVQSIKRSPTPEIPRDLHAIVVLCFFFALAEKAADNMQFSDEIQSSYFSFQVSPRITKKL